VTIALSYDQGRTGEGHLGFPIAGKFHDLQIRSTGHKCASKSLDYFTRLGSVCRSGYGDYCLRKLATTLAPRSTLIRVHVGRRWDHNQFRNVSA
jgi:hypothetical protein